MTAAFSTDPVWTTSAPELIRWVSYAVRAVKITTPMTEMIQLSVPLAKNTLINDATISPMTPIASIPPRPARDRFVTTPYSPAAPNIADADRKAAATDLPV